MFPNTHKEVIFKSCQARFDFMVKWKVNRNPHTELSLTTQQCCHSDTDEKHAFIYYFDSLSISDVSLYNFVECCTYLPRIMAQKGISKV